MKKCLKKLLAVILVASLVFSCSSILASAADTDYDSCLEHYFSKLGGNVPDNVQGSCGYVALSMLLSYYDTYWNDRFVADKYETTTAYKANLSSVGAPALKTENEIWNNIEDAYYNDTSDDTEEKLSEEDFIMEYYGDFVEDNRDKGYLHLDLLGMGIDAGYYDLFLPFGCYMLLPTQMAALLDLYFDGIFGEYRYYDPLNRNAATGENPPISIKLLSTLEVGTNRDDVIEKMEELLENNIPAIYTGVDYKNGDLEAHHMIAYDTVKNTDNEVVDYQFHLGHTSETYEKYSETRFTAFASIMWIEIDTDQLPHICCDKYTTVFGYNVCSCDVYELQHPCHTHKALYDAEMCPLAPIDKRCICGAYVNSPHTYMAEYNNLEHWEECACGAFKNKSAHDFGPYLSYSASLHKKTCDCGYYVAETHVLVRLNLKLYGCAFCNYTRRITDEEMVHLGIDEETEGDLS